LNQRYERATGISMSADAWVAWVAVKAVTEAAARKADGERPCDAVAKLELDGHKGRPLRFDPDTRQLRQPLYVVRGGEVLAQIGSE
jgi:hypothetical protein